MLYGRFPRRKPGKFWIGHNSLLISDVSRRLNGPILGPRRISPTLPLHLSGSSTSRSVKAVEARRRRGCRLSRHPVDQGAACRRALDRTLSSSSARRCPWSDHYSLRNNWLRLIANCVTGSKRGFISCPSSGCFLSRFPTGRCGMLGDSLIPIGIRCVRVSRRDSESTDLVPTVVHNESKKSLHPLSHLSAMSCRE
jgi:hypothetical protein